MNDLDMRRPDFTHAIWRYTNKVYNFVYSSLHTQDRDLAIVSKVNSF